MHHSLSDSEIIVSKDNVARMNNTRKMLQDAIRSTNDAQKCGDDTIVELDRHDEVLTRIDSKLYNNINPNIGRAKSVLSRMWTRTIQNIWIARLTVVVCICIIIMLIVLIIKKT